MGKVWPSIWTKGNDWPNNGEIDIIEGVNLMTYNQMALHTLDGCLAATGTDETGTSGGNNCSVAAGCTVVRVLSSRAMMCARVLMECII